ncbi:MAG: glycosyltransferase [Deltaproteobacteria bacterium]|nr:glycosyltransferase [Deltaproteobacteria bacterium]
MKKVKVVHIVENLDVGGLEKIIASIVKNLDREKYETEVWCLSKGGVIAQEIENAGSKMKIVGMSSYYNPVNILRLSVMLRKTQTDIMHTHGYFAGTFGRLSAIVVRIPVVITHVHSTYFGYTKRNMLIERILSHFTDKIICISHAVKKFVVDNEGISRKRVHVIYNGIESPGEREDRLSRVALGIDDKDIVIVTVASLVPNKGHKVLLDAFHVLSLKHENVRLLLIGDGILRNELERYAERLNLYDRVIFTGVSSDVYLLLRLSDIFVLPTVEREGLGIAIIEAMACGLPVVGSRLGGIPEVIQDQKNGFLFTPGNSQELAQVLGLLVSDGNLRNAAGNAGRKIFAETFTAEEMTRRIEMLYDRFLKRKRGVR